MRRRRIRKSREKFSSAQRPETAERMQYHIRLKEGDIAPYVLLPGDPDRVKVIASFWDESRFLGRHREYNSYTGKYRGVPISSVSTGMGAPAAAIAVEELANIGARTFIRVGSTGAIQRDMNCGDLVITTGAVRHEGTSKQYVNVEYPAAASHDVVLALIQACETLGYRCHVGITCSTDSFYPGQGRPGYGGYKQSWSDQIIPDLQRAGVLNLEMEAAAILVLTNLYNLRGGAICAIFANRVTNEFEVAGEKEACHAADEAVRILHGWDEERKLARKKYWYPSLRR